MGGVRVPPVQEHKHLGLIIDENLTCTSHFQAVYSATAQRFGMLARLEKRLDQESLRKFFDGFVRPRRQYACALWCGGNYQKLVRLQDKFCRRHQIRLPPLKARFEYHTAVLFFKMNSNLSSTYLANLLPASKRQSSKYNLRKCVFPVPSVSKSSSSPKNISAHQSKICI